jgi:hypothetical protein
VNEHNARAVLQRLGTDPTGNRGVVAVLFVVVEKEIDVDLVAFRWGRSHRQKCRIGLGIRAYPHLLIALPQEHAQPQPALQQHQ